MIVTNNGAVRYLTFGKVSIPIRLSIHQMTDAIRHMSKEEHKQIIRDQGIQVPGGMYAKTVMLMAMSFVQINWHEANLHKVPMDIEAKHRARKDQFIKDAKQVQMYGPMGQSQRFSYQLEIPGTPEPTADLREVLQ